MLSRSHVPTSAERSVEGCMPFDGVPPTGGGWWEYQTFSAQLTTPPPPWSRAHSANLALTLLPSDSLVRAMPADTQIGVAASTTKEKSAHELVASDPAA